MTKTMSPEEYQELGRRYYKQKQYDKAVDAFTNSIEAATTPTVTLFDHRAASHEKLGAFAAAVKDGREMIRIDKKDVKGYLRTGNILEKMDKLDTAISIYKYGMKNVPVDNRNFKLLQQLHDKLTRKLSPPMAIDPFTILPVELVEMVIGYLTFRNMVNCLRVCKGWKNYLIKRPNLWVDLDLSGARKEVRRTFVRDAVNRSEYRIRRATIHRFPHTDVLRNVATACKSLTQLEFLSGHVMYDSLIEIVQCATNLKKLVYHIDVTLDCITQVLRHRPNLEHAEFLSIRPLQLPPTWQGPFPKLHTLILNIPKALTGGISLGSASLFPQTPALQTLKVKNWGSAFLGANNFNDLPLKYLELGNCILSQIPMLPETLASLVLAPNQFDVARTGLQISYLPHLTHLSLEGFSNITSEFLALLLDVKADKDGIAKSISGEEYDALSRLQSFTLRHCVPDASVAGLFNDRGGALIESPRILSPSLLSLDLSTQACTDNDIEALVSRCTGLQRLDLSMTNITGASVKMLVDGLPDLQSLNVDNCARISSRDAIVYAERKGVSVSWKQSQASGGRRVRYG